MKNLITIIIAIFVSGLIVTAFRYLFGDSFKERTPDVMAINTINKVNEIDAAIQIYKAEHGQLLLGDYDPVTNPTGTPTFQALVDEGLLKEDALKNNWGYAASEGLVQRNLGTDEMAEAECSAINHIKHKTPKDLAPPSCESNPLELSCCLL